MQVQVVKSGREKHAGKETWILSEVNIIFHHLSYIDSDRDYIHLPMMISLTVYVHLCSRNMFSFYPVTQWLVIHQLSEMSRANYHKSGYLGTVSQFPLTSILCLMTVFVSRYFKAQEDPNLFFLADNKKSNYHHYL